MVDESDFTYIVMPCISGPGRAGWIFEVYRDGERVTLLNPQSYISRQQAEYEAKASISALVSAIEIDEQ